MKIQNKIFLLLLPLIVGPICLVGWVAYGRLQVRSQTALKNQMLSSTNSAVIQLQSKINTAEANIVLYAQSEQVSNFLRTKDESQRYTIMLTPLLRLFSTYQKTFSEYNEIRIIAPDGYEDARFSTSRAVNKTDFEDRSPFFLEASRSSRRTLTTFFRNPDIDAFNMLVSHRVELRDDTRSPVTASPELRGYLVLTISLDFLQRQVETIRFGERGTLFYTDENGKVLFHPDRSRIDDVLPSSYFHALKSAAESNEDLSLIENDNDRIYATGRKVHPKLHLFSTLPPDEYNQAGKARWTLLLFSVISLTAVVIFGAILTIINIQVLIPLGKLNRAVEELGAGKLDSKLVIHRNDEIGKLSLAFNDMVGKLREVTVSHDYVDAVLESMGDSVLVLSPDGGIKKANVGACEFTGYKKGELLEKTLHDLFPDWDRAPLKRVAGGAETVKLEKHITRKSGTRSPVLISTSSMSHSKNSDDIICVIHDITHRINAEKEKFEAQKTAAEQAKQALVGRVAGKMAHDFNNVLSIIMGNAELAMDDCRERETRKTLELIFHQSIRGKNLTKNLIAFAKSQEPKHEFFNIDEKIEFVLNLMQKDLSGIELTRESGAGGQEILADPGMIEHALVNLIQNSIHATGTKAGPVIHIASRISGERIRIEIEDNGCGIADEHLKHIFEPSFSMKGSRDTARSYRSDIKGTGYGLANVKKYIAQHSGSISAESEFGAWTRFTISLPVVRKTLTREEKLEIAAAGMQSGKTILLVEDEPSIANVQNRILSGKPCLHSVDIAPDGKTAVDLLKGNTYDLVSLDHVLPGDLSGLDVYNNLRKENGSVPVLFISGNLDFLKSIKRLKQNDPLIDHLAKPFRNKEFVNRINKLLEKADHTT